MGHLTGTHVTVVLPEDVPHTKIDGVRRMGGEAVPAPRPYEKRMAVARQLMEEHGYTMVHAFEDPHVMAGQGTIGLEVLEDLPELDTIVVPVSGGGLMSGISTAVKGKKPSVRTVGAQAANSDGFAASWRAGKKVRITSEPTIADGLTCSAPSEPDYSIIKKNVDQFITASEENIQEAMRLVAGEVKLLAEPSSCVGIGAFLGGDYHPAPGEKVCFVLSGGNWDVDQIGKVFNHEPVEAVL